METIKLLTFYATNTSVVQAKRKASIQFNKLQNSIDSFNYVTSNGTYVFTRRNKISPNGFISFGKWQ